MSEKTRIPVRNTKPPRRGCPAEWAEAEQVESETTTATDADADAEGAAGTAEGKAPAARRKARSSAARSAGRGGEAGGSAGLSAGAPVAAAGVPAFDAAAVCDERGIYRQNKKDGAYFLRAADGEFVALAFAELKLFVRFAVKFKADVEAGEMESQIDILRRHIIGARRVDYVLEGYAGHAAGVYDCAGVRVLAVKGPRHLEPCAGDFSTITVFIRGLLPPDADGVDQAEVFLGWLQMAVRSVRGVARRSGQMLLLVGKKNDGKSRLQHFIITPLLGGRSADPADWLLGQSAFNSECFGSEHLLMEDTPASLKRDERNQFKQRLKGVAVNDTHRYHEKGRPAATLRPEWRLTMSLNDGPNDLALVPEPAQDWTEKAIMLYTARPEFLPATDAERDEWRGALAREMPAFLHYLLHVHEIQPEYWGGRFGVMSYENPAIRRHLEDAAPWAEVLAVIDELQPWTGSAGGGVWKGKLHEVEAMLTDSTCDDWQAMERLLKKHSLPWLLRQIMSEKPERLGKSRTGTKGGGRYWLIFPPKGWKPDGANSGGAGGNQSPEGALDEI